MPAKVMSGARAKVGMYKDGIFQPMGIFSNISYGVVYGAQPAFILGRYSAAEIDYTDVDIVHISASGWRVVGHGIHVDGGLPHLEELMTADYITMMVQDRQSDTIIARIDKVRPVSGSGGFSARQLADMTMSYLGILVSDESAPDGETESPNANELLDNPTVNV